MDYKILPSFTAADNRYLHFLAVHIYSLSTAASPSTCLEVTIYHQNISIIEQKKIEALIDNRHRIIWIEVTKELCEQIGGPNISNLPANYFRLLAPYTYCEYERVVYLDADTIICDSLEPLYNITLDGNGVGAVLDWLPNMKHAIQNWENLKLNPKAPYFNSGLLVMDSSVWRRENISRRAKDICEEDILYLNTKEGWAQHEQYGLNIAINGNWKKLSTIWNHFTERPIGKVKPKVLHYLGQGKPGSKNCLPHFTNIFNQIINNTPWKEYMTKS